MNNSSKNTGSKNSMDLRTQRNRKVTKAVMPGSNNGRRRQILLLILGLGFVALLWSAANRQIIQQDYLQVQGERRYLRELSIPAHRGEVTDRNGEPLAISSPMVSVWVDPRNLPTNPKFLNKLSQIIGMSLTELQTKIAQNNKRGFVYLRRGLSPEVGQRVLALIDQYRLGSVGLKREYQRYYPSGEITAHVVGITDAMDKGQEGIEKSQEAHLAGRPGLRKVIQDGRRLVVEEVELIRAPVPGQPLTLSLDRRLQFLTYLELKRAVDANNAKAGTAVVLDAQTSEVLAMVNQPSFNPNDRSTLVPATMRNRAVIDLFEPGSTIKPLLVAASVDAGKSTPRTPINTNPGHMRIGRYTVRDGHNYGLLNVTSVITKSSNVGVTKLALAITPEYMWRVYANLGIGQRTDLHFPGEVSGFLPHFSGWSAFEQATHSFGYGLSITALQLASAYAVIAADGIKHPISMTKLTEVPAGVRVLKASTAIALRQMMETVISDKGTAKRAAVEGYRAAGKTGTVKKAVAGGYAQHRYLGVFAGMIPADNPRLVMVIMIDEPRGDAYYGGLVAAPVFAGVMTSAMRLLNVPPSEYPVEKALNQPISRLASTGRRH